MKYAKFITLLGVSLIAGCVVGATQPSTGVPTEKSQAQWKVVIPQTMAGDKMRMAAFTDESFGVTGGVGDVGKAHYTTDGGKTWTMANSSSG